MIDAFFTFCQGMPLKVHDPETSRSATSLARPTTPRWPPGCCTKVLAVEHPFLAAMAPVAEALGARIVLPAEVSTLDIELRWEGQLVGALRLPKLQGALDRLIDQVEKELGGSLEHLSREDKQRAVKMLDDRGAFELRRSVEDVADTFGVSRITIYNYLNATRR
jgi:HTH domain